MFEALIMVRIAIVIIGAVLCVLDFLSYCKQKLLNKFAFILALIGITMIVVGAVPALSDWLGLFAIKGGIIIVICLVIGIWLIYSACVSISDLTYKNQELAIQVSLLNSESAQHIAMLNELMDERELVKK